MKIKNKEEETHTTTCITYTLEYKGFEVVAEVIKEFSTETGEMQDEVDILSSDRELTDEEIEEISEFLE